MNKNLPQNLSPNLPIAIEPEKDLVVALSASQSNDVPATRDSLSDYLKKVNKIPSLSAEEEFMLAKAYLEQKDAKAAQKLVASHLKLVVKIAMSYKNYGIPISDMVSEGSIGLMHAVKKYKPELGFRLSTYAMWWIKAYIQEYILKSWSLVKIGTTSAQKKLFFNLSKIKNKLLKLYNRSITEEDYEEISKQLGVSKNEAKELDRRLSNKDVSLNSIVKSDESSSTELMDFLPDESPNQEAVLVANRESYLKKQALLSALKTLDEREFEIIKLRRLTQPSVTLNVLSEKFCISKERVRQIENKVYNKIKKHVLSYFNKDIPQLT